MNPKFKSLMDKATEYMQDVSIQMNKSVYERLLECLRNEGCDTNSEPEFIEILHRYCHFELHRNGLIRFFYLKKCILEWYDTIDIEQKDDKIIITYGKPPYEININY